MIYNDKSISFKPKPYHFNTINRLMKLREIETRSKICQDLFKYKELRYLKKDKELITVWRNGKGQSLIKLKPYVKMSYNKNRFWFKF